MKEAQNFGPDAAEIKCLPLYSSLPPQQQQKIFEPAPASRVSGGPPVRKLIVSTSILPMHILPLPHTLTFYFFYTSHILPRPL
jgi:hypothetical protein